jgi:CubicO group peptidase (beta-lactamase class C family)
MVLGLQRGDEVHIDAIGTAGVGTSEPMRSDAIFRITSMTRPVTAVAVLLLVDQGRLELDEPVDRLLPELGTRRVLRTLNGPVDDSVAADRPISVRDLLTFRGGFGMILASPEEYPILAAEESLGLRSVGPPTPASSHDPDEWMSRMGSLPLMDQPGRQWRYSTGSQILGVLVARASGQSLASFYRRHIFEPLGMNDTGFMVPSADRDRLVPCYHESDGALVPFDDGGQWAEPRPFPDGGAGLISTVGDYLAFARMLANTGMHRGVKIVTPELVAAMTTDQLTAQQRATAGPILDGRGWGFGLSIIDPPEGGGRPKGYGWSGGFGTVWTNDPDDDLSAILCTQVLANAGSGELEADFWSAVDRAIG